MALCESLLAEAVASHTVPAAPLQVISALAEGADTLAAEIALARGAALEAPLPFPAGEYAGDFAAGAARDTFHALLARAARVRALAGSRARADAAYEAVGRLVVGECDALLAVWDGAPAAGRGGTAQIVDYAKALGRPVAWVHASEARPPCLIASALAESPLAEMRGRLLPLLAARAGGAKR